MASARDHAPVRAATAVVSGHASIGFWNPVVARLPETDPDDVFAASRGSRGSACRRSVHLGPIVPDPALATRIEALGLRRDAWTRPSWRSPRSLPAPRHPELRVELVDGDSYRAWLRSFAGSDESFERAGRHVRAGHRRGPRRAADQRLHRRPSWSRRRSRCARDRSSGSTGSTRTSRTAGGGSAGRSRRRRSTPAPVGAASPRSCRRATWASPSTRRWASGGSGTWSASSPRPARRADRARRCERGSARTRVPDARTRGEPHPTPPDGPIPPKLPVVGGRFMRHHAWAMAAIDEVLTAPADAPSAPVAPRRRSRLRIVVGFVFGFAIGLAAVAAITAGALITWDRSYEARVLPGVTAGGDQPVGHGPRPGDGGAREGLRPRDHRPRRGRDRRRRRLGALRPVRPPRRHRRDGPGGARDRPARHHRRAGPGRGPARPDRARHPADAAARRGCARGEREGRALVPRSGAGGCGDRPGAQGAVHDRCPGGPRLRRDGRDHRGDRGREPARRPGRGPRPGRLHGDPPGPRRRRDRGRADRGAADGRRPRRRHLPGPEVEDPRGDREAAGSGSRPPRTGRSSRSPTSPRSRRPSRRSPRASVARR